jgi:hypothetical protein
MSARAILPASLSAHQLPCRSEIAPEGDARTARPLSLALHRPLYTAQHRALAHAAALIRKRIVTDADTNVKLSNHQAIVKAETLTWRSRLSPRARRTVRRARVRSMVRIQTNEPMNSGALSAPQVAGWRASDAPARPGEHVPLPATAPPALPPTRRLPSLHRSPWRRVNGFSQ